MIEPETHDALDLLLYKALKDYTPMAKEIKEIESDTTPVIISKKFKLRLNRFFREKIGRSSIPYPEVDNSFERLRSFLIARICKKQK